MSAIEETVEVGVPLSTAYNQWTQYRSFPLFMPAVQHVEQIRPTMSRWVVGIGPLHVDFDAEIVEQEPDSFIVWRSLGRRVHQRGRVAFREIGPERTEVTMRMEVAPRGAAGVLSLLPPLTRRLVRRALERFAEFVEERADEDRGWRGTIREGHVAPAQRHRPRRSSPRWPVG